MTLEVRRIVTGHDAQGKAVVASDERGLSSDYKEAIAFALLASARIDGVAGNVPEVTGARRPVLLGKITEC